MQGFPDEALACRRSLTLPRLLLPMPHSQNRANRAGGGALAHSRGTRSRRDPARRHRCGLTPCRCCCCCPVVAAGCVLRRRQHLVSQIGALSSGECRRQLGSNEFAGQCSAAGAPLQSSQRRQQKCSPPHEQPRDLLPMLLPHLILLLPCAAAAAAVNSCADESIDEIAAFLGVGEQVAALTAQ